MVKKGSGILLVFTDIDPKYEEEFNAWYDTEQLGSLLTLPGLPGCRPLCCRQGRPQVSGCLRAGECRRPEDARAPGLPRQPEPLEPPHLAHGHREERHADPGHPDLPSLPGDGGACAWRRRFRSDGCRCPSPSIASGTSGTTANTSRVTARCRECSMRAASAWSTGTPATRPSTNSRTRRSRRRPPGTRSGRDRRRARDGCARP